MLENFDADNNVVTPTGAHCPPSYKQDLNMLVQELQQNKVFDHISGWKHQSFKKPKDLLHGKSDKEIVSWLSNVTLKR